MKYKINLHTHTIFSDGRNSPIIMAQEAKRLGHCALVLTDHFKIYDSKRDLNPSNLPSYKLACEEASKVLPVVTGVELGILQNEVLVFGGALIKELFAFKEALVDQSFRLTVDILEDMKRRNGGALILCHPRNTKEWAHLLPILDGFEKYNGGANWFKRRSYGCLGKLPSWCNSDAHSVEHLRDGYNLVNTKIDNEAKLIKFIKSGKQPAAHLSPKYQKYA